MDLIKTKRDASKDGGVTGPTGTSPTGTSPTGTSPAIQVVNLFKQYSRQSVPTLNGVTFAVNVGERVAVLGSNGAGKSTLFRILLGLVPASSGLVNWFGVETSAARSGGATRWFRRQVGFIPQNHALSPTLSVLSNVLHGRLGRGNTLRRCFQALATRAERNEAMQLLERFGLASRALSACGQLSGGESQRVALARAFFGHPRVFIADEPAASLDPSIAQEMMQALNLCATETSATLLFATHHLDHAIEFSDRILALRDGKIVLDAATRDVSIGELRSIYV